MADTLPAELTARQFKGAKGRKQSSHPLSGFWVSLRRSGELTLERFDQTGESSRLSKTPNERVTQMNSEYAEKSEIQNAKELLAEIRRCWDLNNNLMLIVGYAEHRRRMTEDLSCPRAEKAMAGGGGTAMDQTTAEKTN